MLKQRFIVQFGSTFFVKILAMIAGIFVARIAGPEVLGTVAYGAAYVSIWAFLTGLFSTAHIKLIAEGRNLGNCVMTYAHLQAASITLLISAVVLSYIFQKFVFGHIFETKDQEAVIFIFLAAFILTKILDFGNTTFIAKQEQVKANYPLFIKSLIWYPGRILVVLMGLKAIALVTWELLASLIAIIFAWRFVKNLPKGNFNKTLALEYLSFVPPIAIVVVVNSLLTFSGNLVLGNYSGIEELGYFAAAYSLGGLFLLIAGATGQIFFPLFSQSISKGDWVEVNRKVISFQEFSALFIFPVVIIGIF
jgi:O-antigen/teichoic acid export membrane protein